MFNQLSNQRGQALIAMGITLIVFFGLVALAMDFGRIAQTVNELQIAADAGASAGVFRLFNGTAANPPQTAGAQMDALSEALGVLEQNYVNGHLAMAGDATAQNGTYTPGTPPTFVANNSPANAVQVTITETVHNIFGVTLLSTPDSPYTRVATAKLEGISTAAPNSRDSVAAGGAPRQGTLPLALGDSATTAFFTAYAAAPQDCTLLPTMVTLIPGTGGSNDVGWTSFTAAPGAAPNGTLEPYLPNCCPNPCNMTPPPSLTVGNSINFVPANPGVDDNNVLNQVDTCRMAGVDTYTIPVVPGTGVPLAGAANVSGFVTVKVTAVNAAAGTLTVNLLCNAQMPGPVGGGDFGTGSVVLVTNPPLI